MSEGKKSYAERVEDFIRGLHEIEDYPAGKRRPKAEVLEFPEKLSREDLWRRQCALDVAWERTLEARRELERDQAATCHRGPSDPDWPGRRR